MKFLVLSLAVLACSTLAMPQGGEMSMEGEKPMMSMEDMFLMKLQPIVMKMKKMMMEKAKEEMGDMPKLDELIKGKVCYGQDSEIVNLFKAAKEECGCGEEMMEGKEQMVEMEDDSEEGSMEMEDDSEEGSMEMDEDKQKMMQFLECATDKIQSGEATLMDVLKKMKKIKMFMMFKAKMEQTKCFLKAINWINVNEETHEVTLNREVVAEQLANLQFDASDVEGTCYDKVQEITLEDCSEEGDDDMDDEMPTAPESRQKNKKNKNKKKSKKNKKNKGKKNQKNQEEPEMPEMPEMSEEDKAAMQESLLKAVKNLAYVGCVMGNVEKGCYEAVMAQMEENMPQAG